MPKTIYDEEEVYLTTKEVKYATGYDRAKIVYYLIKELLANGQSKDGAIEAVLARCAKELEPAII